MLNAMRAGAGGIFAKVMLILLILSFGVWGIGDMLRSGGGSGAVASVNGHDIARQPFERALRNAQEEMRQKLGKNYTPEAVRSLHLERKVLEDMITAHMLQLEVKSLGIIPPDDAVADAFRDDDGTFNKAAFQNAQHSSGLNERAFVDEVRRQMAIRLLTNSIAAAAPVNSAMQRVLYGIEHEERTADIAELTPALIKDIPAPTEAQIKTFYDAHKNQFMTPEFRLVHSLTISKAELLKAENKPEDKLNEAVVSFSNKLEDRLAGGDTLKEAATALKARYSEMGPFDRDGKSEKGEKLTLPAGIVDTAFATEQGHEMRLAPSKDGTTYTMQRIDVTQPQAPLPLEKVRAKAVEALRRQEALVQLATLAQDIDKEAQASKTPLSVLAKRGISTTPSGTLKRTEKSTLPTPLLFDIFTSPVGQATGVYPTQNGFALAVVKTRRTPVNISAAALEKDTKFTLYTLDVDRAARNDLLDEYLRVLQKKYRVKVNAEALAAYSETSAQE